MSASKEKCADKDKSVCGYNESGRLRYFHGMLLDDKDFTAEQRYHINKRRFLNRMLHGSGVVCGLGLEGEKDGRWIEVKSGFALDCSGNEIWVPHDERIELASLLPPKDKGKDQAECEEPDDQGKPKTYYIGIRYDEKPTNPVSVYLPSGNCEERTCENSRYKEGYCIEVVQCCPEKNGYSGVLKDFCDCQKYPDRAKETVKKAEGTKSAACPICDKVDGDEKKCKCIKLEEFCEQSVPCPECSSCDKPCFVVLGQITVDKDCRLDSVCINECRRYVLTGHLLRHMFRGVFTGSEDYFYADVNGQKNYFLKKTDEMAQSPIEEMAQNPIKALCLFLRYKLIEDGKFKYAECGVEKKDRDSNVEEQMYAMQVQLRKLSDSNEQLRVDLSRANEDVKVHSERVEEMREIVRQIAPDKFPAIEVQQAAEKQPAAKSPKASQK
jgi:hypothetical protein